MTRDEILALEGWQLRKAIAELMGWTDVRLMVDTVLIGTPPEGGPSTDVPRYPTDISAAWQVVEKMMKHWFYILRTVCVGHECEFYRYGQTVRNTSDTAPLAICRAALLAVFAENDNKEEQNAQKD